MATRTREQLTKGEYNAELVDGLDLGPAGDWAGFESFRTSKFFGEYLNRLVSGRDMHMIVTAASETGVGKTTLAASLALMLDQQGWTHEKAAVASAQQYAYKYDRVEPGSVLILDEAEKAADARRGMSSENVEVSQAFAAKRYLQVFGILTAPSKSWVEKRLGSDAADYWIQAQETDMGRPLGEAKVYRLRTNEHYGEDYTKKTETIHWPILDWHPEFKRLDAMKREMLETDEKPPYVHRDKLEKARETEYERGRDEREREIIERMSELGYSQPDIGEVVGLHQSTVSRRLNSDD